MSPPRPARGRTYWEQQVCDEQHTRDRTEPPSRATEDRLSLIEHYRRWWNRTDPAADQSAD